MATLFQKIEAEKRMRELLEESSLPQPDRVEYGFTCIRLFFEETKTVVVVDIDEPRTPRSTSKLTSPNRLCSGGILTEYDLAY
jgi:hypothetical protein